VPGQPRARRRHSLRLGRDEADPEHRPDQAELRFELGTQAALHGSYFIATCEFDGRLVKVDTASHRVLGYLTIGGMPPDIKIDPAGKVWYVSDMQRGGVHLVDGDALKETGFVPTGPEAHGLYPSRDASRLYISNRVGPTCTPRPTRRLVLRRRHQHRRPRLDRAAGLLQCAVRFSDGSSVCPCGDRPGRRRDAGTGRDGC